MDDEKRLILRKPVTVGDVTYEHLDLHEPTAGELAKATASGSPVEQSIQLISIVAKLPRAVISGLCQRDFQEAAEYLAGFTVTGHPTGEISSPN